MSLVTISNLFSNLSNTKIPKPLICLKLCKRIKTWEKIILFGLVSWYRLMNKEKIYGLEKLLECNDTSIQNMDVVISKYKGSYAENGIVRSLLLSL